MRPRRPPTLARARSSAPLVIYALQERLTNSGLDEYGQIVLGGILVVIILFAPEGLYERLRQPRRAVLAGVALVVGTAVAAFADWGIATDWLSTGLAAATVVLLVARPSAAPDDAAAQPRPPGRLPPQ